MAAMLARDGCSVDLLSKRPPPQQNVARHLRGAASPARASSVARQPLRAGSEPGWAFYPRASIRLSSPLSAVITQQASRYPFEMRCTKAGLRLAIPMIHSNMVHVPTLEGTASASRNPLTICLYIAQVRTGPSTMSRREWQQSLLSTVTTPHNRLQAHRQVTTGDSHTP
jgi:hypothetical protein